jgi:hypothetical protein
LLEYPAFFQPKAQRLEKTGADKANLRHGKRSGSQGRRAFDQESRHHLRRFERKNACGAGGKNSGGLHDLIEKLLEEVVGRGTVVAIPRFRKGDFDTEKMVCAEPRINGEQLLKASNDQCAEKQYHDQSSVQERLMITVHVLQDKSIEEVAAILRVTRNNADITGLNLFEVLAGVVFR